MSENLLQIVLTRDGSHTVFSEKYKSTYHSMHGALSESKHVFIEAGLKYTQGRFDCLNILEIGFGTGLNALLTYITAVKPVHYTSIEKDPLPPHIYSNLNYPEFVQCPDELFTQLHQAEWNKKITLNHHFSIHKYRSDLLISELTGSFNLIYFDAFAPTSQIEIWNEKILRRIYNLTEKGGVLVSFCAKGDFKRLLKKIGFTVETLPGAPGKREMTRALK